METWQLVARECIRDLVARYNSYGDRGRFDDLLKLFAPDAIMDLDGDLYEGVSAIRTIFTKAAAEIATHAGGAPVLVRHVTSTLVIDVDTPATARSRCYYQVLMRNGLDHWGRYTDDYATVDGEWRFAKRRESLDGTTPGGWAASRTAGG